MQRQNSLLFPRTNSFDPADTNPSVLFVLGTLWGENGITSHLMTLSQELLKRGWNVGLTSALASDVDGAYEEANRSVEQFEACGVQSFPISSSPLRSSFSRISKIYQTLFNLRRIIQEFRPNIIHSHSLSICPYLQLVKLIDHVPYVSTCHVEPTVNRAISF